MKYLKILNTKLKWVALLDHAVFYFVQAEYFHSNIVASPCFTAYHWATLIAL